MRRHAAQSGTRDEVLAELRDSAEGWPRMGRDDLGADALQAVDAITGGATEVRVGHIVYTVTD
jgi:hypothetical protein